MAVRVQLPRVLAEVTGGARLLSAPAGSLGDVLDAVAAAHPLLDRRLRDETGALRRYVNVYVDGTDVRGTGGLTTQVTDEATVEILPSVAGGSA